MGKGATVRVRDPRGIERMMTPLAWSLIKKSSNGNKYQLLDEPEEKKTQELNEPEDVSPVAKEEIDSDVDEIGELRKQYLDKFGKEPDKRWKEPRLKKELTQED